MTPYGKMSQTAIAALSSLAEQSDRKPPTYLGANEIAASRNLPVPAVRKVMTTLSQAGLVSSAPGPGGGFVLAKPPGKISLQDIVRLFERLEENLSCPFGPDWCGTGPQCPLHNEIAKLRDISNQFLKEHTLADLAKPTNGPARRMPATVPSRPVRRSSSAE